MNKSINGKLAKPNILVLSYCTIVRGGTGSVFTEPGRIRVFKKFQNRAGRAGYTRSVEKLVNDQCSKQ